eukprot:1392963-Amorphochlora_amoeboformis.AAC.1
MGPESRGYKISPDLSNAALAHPRAPFGAWRPCSMVLRGGSCLSGAKIVPEVERLLKDVKCEEHADKFSSLEEFMRTSKLVLKLEKGIDSTKQRKWILKQSEYARQLHRLGILKERVLVEEMVEGEELDESAEGEQTEKIS